MNHDRSAGARRTGGPITTMFNSLHNRLRVWLEMLTTSFWFVPGIMLTGVAVLAFACLWIDARGYADNLPALVLYQGGLEGARAVLSTLGGSMITLTGVVFSLTLVALTLTANQFGPRLLRTFMRSTSTQVTLGAFVCAFVYSLLVLSRVREGENALLVPRLSVNVGVAMGIVNAGLLVYFIHHVAQSIHANRVVELAALELEAVVRRMPPLKGGGTQASGPWPGGGIEVPARRRGYILSMEEDHLVAVAAQHHWQVCLRHRPGDFIAVGQPLFEVRAPPGQRVSEEAQRNLVEAVSVGRQRSLVQDLEAGLLQLTEIAVRSLSPGINDPCYGENWVKR